MNKVKWYETLTPQQTFDRLVRDARQCHYLQTSSGIEVIQFDKIPDENVNEMFNVLIIDGIIRRITRASTSGFIKYVSDKEETQ